jgi:F0F1-type ATP synthase epsilon subunit
MAKRQIASTGQIVDDGKKKAGIKEVNGQPIMHIKVYSPYKVYFDEDGYSISAVNDTGPFDILPRHHNFMTLLNPCDVIVHSLHDVQKIRINRGIMHVKADSIVVFLDV